MCVLSYLRFLKERAHLLPRLTEDGENVVFCPAPALRYLGDTYKPKDRGTPHVESHILLAIKPRCL